MRISLLLILLLTGVVLGTVPQAWANPALEGYSNQAELAARLEKLKAIPNVRVTSLGKTLGGRDLPLITLGAGQVDDKPAILIVGNVSPGHLVGAEVVLRLAEKIAAQASGEPWAKLLTQRTIYLLPQPSPDTAEKCFVKPYREPQGNARPTDDDRDGEQGEDAADDLNGDGWITMMRIADPAGEYLPHPADARVLIKADPTKNERGIYRLLVEGRDQDGDEQWNEDTSGGVNFNRNFTFNYPAFKPHAGINQVSELETRAIADFCFDHPNIAAVWTMTPEDNLLQPWKADAQKDKARIRTNILANDAGHQDYVAGLYQKLVKNNGLPNSPAGEGAFSEWAYFHYGRWSWASRVWWVPTIEEKPAEGEKAPKSDEKRGADELNALRYFADRKIDGFVDWAPVEQPGFPGQKVEVGGFKPFYRLNPPAGDLDGLVAKQHEFLLQALALSPTLQITEQKAEALGSGVVRLTLTIQNQGYLPTMPEMGDVNRQAYPLQISWKVPEKTTWLQGTARSRLPRLTGQGGQVERTWLVRLPEPMPEALTVTIAAPSVGSITQSIPLK
ncbi:MAG TPA: M14 family metallopeptidase [Pirellulaceae bacterium]|nr:M14 family metallopeptidase [Pirellulaceae bacterium]